MGKKNKDSLGRSLIKDRFAKTRHQRHVEDNTLVCQFITIKIAFRINKLITTFKESNFLF